MDFRTTHDVECRLNLRPDLRDCDQPNRLRLDCECLYGDDARADKKRVSHLEHSLVDDDDDDVGRDGWENRYRCDDAHLHEP